MKKFKVSLLAVAAIFLGICGSAFTNPGTPDASGKPLDGWFIYNGGDISDPLNYTYSGTVAQCNASVRFCAMKGNQQPSPNQSRPTLESLDAASSASNEFTNQVADLVIFKP